MGGRARKTTTPGQWGRGASQPMRHGAHGQSSSAPLAWAPASEPIRLGARPRPRSARTVRLAGPAPRL
ncbi:hypothetical protein U9M48_038322 [Paspalum notatum var. saurae]|uniref:Uncharacterized protein n=1 Tax=Paspalum notatum var. saurae TaxID=547442 RepID=A0AAQ3UL39_PASNO